MPEELEYRILGPLAVRGGEVIEIRRARLRALLGCLLLGGGDTFSIARLVEAVWGPGAPPSADGLVRVYVSQLRQVLGENAIVTRPGGYAVADPGERLDAERFRRLVDEAKRRRDEGDDDRAAALFDEALALWSGEVLADTPLAEDAAAAAGQLADLRLQAVEEHAAAELRLGRHHELIGVLDREVRANPTSERLVEELMVALYRSGRQTDALAVYADVRRRLVDELGLEPGRGLQELQAQILRHDPELAVPSMAAPPSPPGARRRFAIAAAVVALAGGAGMTGWILTRTAAAPVVRANAVVRFDTGNVRVARVAEPPGVPGALLLTSRGDWVVDTANRRLIEYDPESLASIRHVSLRSLPHALIDAGGTLWLANGVDGTISRLGRRGGIGPPMRPEPHSTGRLALGYGRGSLWIGSQDGRLTRFDPRRGRAVAVIHGVRTPEALAVADGAVWVAQATSVSIVRVDARNDRIAATVPIGGVPSAIVSAAGSVWALAPAEGKLWQIDPRRNSVVGSVAVPGASLLTAAGKALWVADGPDGRLTRLLPLPTRTVVLPRPIASLDAGPTGVVATTK
jgi:DNA-binding SARP family transcriptional activator